jgi:hypothetical protein
MLREVENSIDGAMSALGRTSWSGLKLVSGPSAYVADLEYALESLVDIVKPLIEQKKYLRNFFDKASGCVHDRQLAGVSKLIKFRLVITRFTNSIIKSRPLKEIGAEQVCLTYPRSVSGAHTSPALDRFAKRQILSTWSTRRGSYHGRIYP